MLAQSPGVVPSSTQHLGLPWNVTNALHRLVETAPGLVDIFRKVDTMSRPMADSSKARRQRRQFDTEFKEQAVRLVLDEGKSVGGVARDLDLTETALRDWVKRARADRTKGRTGLTTAEREELARLRKENRILQEEREILKKAAAFFAKHQR